MQLKNLIFLILVFFFTGILYIIVNTVENRYDATAVEIDANHIIEDFQLTNQNNGIFNSEENTDKIWVLNYFFTSCPVVCPKMMKNMQEVHNIVQQNDDIILLSFTVDPKRDTPEQLKKYTERFNIDDDKWQLLTGDKKLLYRLARKSFLLAATDGNGDDHDFIHSENFVIVDKNQKIRSILKGTAEDADAQVLNTINKIKKKEI